MNTNFVTKPNCEFLETISFLDGVAPVRSYIHREGFEFFGNDFASAKDHLKNTLNENQQLLGNLDYMIAILWGYKLEESLMMDIVGWPDAGNWPENKGAQSFIMENGIYLPEEKGVTCGDGFILIGKEEKYRRSTKSLEDYMRNPPVLTNSLDGF